MVKAIAMIAITATHATTILMAKVVMIATIAIHVRPLKDKSAKQIYHYMDKIKELPELVVYDFSDLNLQESSMGNCFGCDSSESDGCDMCDSCDHGW